MHGNDKSKDLLFNHLGSKERENIRCLLNINSHNDLNVSTIFNM